MSDYVFDVYIGVPYSHQDTAVREYRYKKATEYAKVLIERGLNPFSPITHSHPMALLGLSGDWEFWKHIDERIMPVCAELHVLFLDGVFTSDGVHAERKWFRDKGRLVWFINPDNWQPIVDLSNILSHGPNIPPLPDSIA